MDKDLIDEDDFDPTPPPRTRLGVIVVVVLLHVVLLAGIIRAFTPDIADQVVKTVLSTFNVTVITPPPSPTPTPPPPPKPSRDKDAGNEGAAGKKAVAREVKAPQPKIPISNKPAPKASNTGSANTSGAANQGDGTGGGRTGDGTGGGGQGNGPGGGAVSKPSVRSGEIDDSRDFAAPPGGRQTRFGKQVVVVFTVTTDGRAKNCTVQNSSVDAEATARVCPLVVQRIRFNPAKRADGTPIEARYGYRVRFDAK